jgi:hypothetical protein
MVISSARPEEGGLVAAVTLRHPKAPAASPASADEPELIAA